MEDEDVSVFEWIIVHLLLAIPVINLIMLIYWSVSSTTKISKRNYARSFIIFIPFIIVVFGLMSAMAIPAFQKVREQSREKAIVNYQLELNREAGGDATAYRIFTAKDGRSIKAKIIGFYDEMVIIKREDGREFDTRMDLYSKEDQDYIMKVRNHFTVSYNAPQ